jgi:pimeloyl-ACP methyl ester carboxylesterase
VVALSVPPFTSLQGTAAIRVLPRQIRNSWYIMFNRLPLLPERYLEPLVRKLWRDWSPGYDASGDLPAVLTAVRGPAHRRAVIGYYRAMASPFGPPAAYRQWQGAEMKAPLIPLLYLHGAQDGCLDPRLADMVEAHLLPGSVVDVIGGAGHFLQLEQPDVVNARILAYLADSPGAVCIDLDRSAAIRELRGHQGSHEGHRQETHHDHHCDHVQHRPR